MSLRPISILRWALPALLCLGLCGLSGCSRGYHPQFARSLGGGGVIGKGPSPAHKGKRRGIEQREAARAFGTTSRAKSDPFAGLGGSSPRKQGQPNLARPRPAPGARTARPPKAPNLFDSTHRSARKRAEDPFKDF